MFRVWEVCRRGSRYEARISSSIWLFWCLQCSTYLYQSIVWTTIVLWLLHSIKHLNKTFYALTTYPFPLSLPLIACQWRMPFIFCYPNDWHCAAAKCFRNFSECIAVSASNPTRLTSVGFEALHDLVPIWWGDPHLYFPIAYCPPGYPTFPIIESPDWLFAVKTAWTRIIWVIYDFTRQKRVM